MHSDDRESEGFLDNQLTREAQSADVGRYEGKAHFVRALSEHTSDSDRYTGSKTCTLCGTTGTQYGTFKMLVRREWRGNTSIAYDE